MEKEDCKYWDKCYQKNDQHLKKYNHPSKDNKEVAKRRNSEDAEKDDATSTVGNKKSDNLVEPQEIDTRELRQEALSNIAGKNYMETLRKRIKLSIQAEYDELLQSNDFIRHKFLVEMPEEFYTFWNFVKEQAKGNPQPTEYFEKHFQLQLVGPFDFLAGKFQGATIKEPGDYLRHWRFYYDPPEFQTIFVKKGTAIHYGYWRDEPKTKEKLLIARNDTSKGCEFEFVAGNSFEAFLYYLDKDFKSTPFNAAFCSNSKKSLQKFIEANHLRLDKLDAVKSERDKKVVTKTFHRAGIVVPVDHKTNVGYRPLLTSDVDLKTILHLFDRNDDGNTDKEAQAAAKAVVLEKLQPIITAASIAVDECDFGTSLELGIDFFCSGYPELHSISQSLIIPAYTLLQRPQFIAIFKAHMDARSKNLNLSIFDIDKK